MEGGEGEGERGREREGKVDLLTSLAGKTKVIPHCIPSGSKC